jgi:IS5 family transposase
MGRFRGGLTSKIHALVDADGRAIALRLTGGQVHDSQEAEALLEAMPEGATLLGDKGYDSSARPQTGRTAGPISRPDRTESNAPPSQVGSTANAISSNASSIGSSTSAASRPVTTRTRPTTSLLSN